jgi:putative DNA primase/helicase
MRINFKPSPSFIETDSRAHLTTGESAAQVPPGRRGRRSVLRALLGLLFPGVDGNAAHSAPPIDPSAQILAPRDVVAHRGRGNLGLVNAAEYWDFARLQRFVSEPIAASVADSAYRALNKDEQNALKKKDPFVLFGNCKGGVRDDAHVLSRSVVALDIDDDATGLFNDLTLRGGADVPFAFVWHTTRSHTDEKPRLRVLVPLSRDVTPDEYRRLTATLGAQFGAKIDPASVKPSQMMFAPVCNAGAPFKSGTHAGGGYIVPDTLFAAGSSAGSPAPRDTVPAREMEDLDHALYDSVSDETIEDLRGALAHLASKGWMDDGDGKRDKWIKVGQNLKRLGEPGCDLFIEASNRGDNPDSEDQLRERFAGFDGDRSGYKAIFKAAQDEGWANPRRHDYSSQVDRTDTGNANLLCQLTNGDLRYVTEKRLWLWWDGEKWIPDDSGGIAQSQALRVAEHHQKEAAQYQRQSQDASLTSADRKRIERTADSIAKWAAQCRNRRTLDNMLAVASKFPKIQLSLKDLDTDPLLFGVANGVVDLTTGGLRPAAREDFVTKRSPIRFNPDARAPKWLDFVNQITGRAIDAESSPVTGEAITGTVGRFKSRPALAHYLHKAMGYSLTGVTEQHKLFVCVGAGSNGKNVLLDTVKWVLGDYGVSIPPAALLETHQSNDPERASPIAARLAGARAAISSENKPGQKFDVATIKSHTGDGYMTARFLNQNAFEFEISHKLWLMTNSTPSIDHLDGAIRGRLHFVPFDRKWNRPGESDRNPTLPDGDPLLTSALRGEAEGILAWLVEGARAYVSEGLTPPAEVVNMTRAYFADQDFLGRWLEQYERCDPKQGETATALFDAFGTWCDDEGIDNTYTLKKFGPTIYARGIPQVKRETGMHYGLRRREDA